MKTMSRLGLCSARLLLALLAVLSSSHAAERTSLNAITRFPYQDTTRSNSEAFPLALSGQTVLFVWAESTGIRYSKSTDGGVTWIAPVHFVTPVRYANQLTGIRTFTGRLIIFWNDTLGVKHTRSDDGGLSWSPTTALSVSGYSSLQVSQTAEGRIWLAGYANIGPTRYVTSVDNGSTWSATQSLPSPPKNDACFVDGQGASVHCIYSTLGTQPNIERITSSNGGATWSAATPILNTSVPEKRPRIAKQSNGTIWLLYDFTRVDSLPTSYQKSDVNFVTSTDSGITWSSPSTFTRYVGNDFKHNVTMLNDETFVTFASDRWLSSNWWGGWSWLWYGIIGETPDENPPPILLLGGPYHCYSDLENWFQAFVDDESGISSVTANYSINGISQPPLQLFDDGMHFDRRPEDNIWGVGVPSFPIGFLEWRFAVRDFGGNTLNIAEYLYADITAPPPSSHVTQGSSMRVAFNKLATFGKESLPDNYPAFGLRYPANSTIEHVFGAGIWVGGKIDTTTAGTGERIKVVSVCYHDYYGGGNEFHPPSSSDSIWRVYGRNAPQPPGWEQYWGNALSFRPVGDENFFNQYNDYTQPVAGHVAMKVKVIQSSFTWNDQQGDGVQILEFKIMNISERSIDSAYIAFFMDGDVDIATRNYSGYYSTDRMGYIHNPVDFGSTPVGVSVLNSYRPLDSLRLTFYWYQLYQSPWSDSVRYSLMSLGTIKPDEYPSLSDTRFLLSFGPFTIQPYTSSNPDTLRVAFALLSALDLNQLQVHASRARDIYQVISGVNQISLPIPDEFALEQNYPNPFNPSTTIRYNLPKDSRVSLKLFNILGQQVAQLVNEQQQAGYHDVVFRGDGLASGVYFYRLQAGNFVETKKLLLLK